MHDALQELDTMLSAWKDTYDAIPSVLVLLGWWTPTPEIDDIYTAYVPQSDGNRVRLVEMT